MESEKWYKWTYLQKRNRHTDFENKLMVIKSERLGEKGAWDEHIHTITCKINNQQRPTVWHRDLYSLFRNKLYGKRIWKIMDVCVCIIESLCCTPEANTTL